jgi:hypothetical protein
MIDPTASDGSEPIDDLVREHFEREEAAVDAPRMLARIRAARQSGADRPRNPWLKLGAALVVGMGIGAASAVLLLVRFESPMPPGSQSNEVMAATPAELMRSVFVAHSDDTDRLYDVKVELGNTGLIARKYPFLPAPAHYSLIKDSKLWVRGNQFVVDPGPETRPMCWGRDRDSRVWVVVNPRLGLQYGPDEDNDPVSRLCNLMSLRVPMLAADMLDSYELSRSSAGGPDAPIRIVGSMRNNSRDVAVSHVTLELDPKTKVIRKAVQKRTVRNDWIGTFTYTLVETGHRPDSQYELLGHLEPGSKVMDARDTTGRNDTFNRCPPFENAKKKRGNGDY